MNPDLIKIIDIRISKEKKGYEYAIRVVCGRGPNTRGTHASLIGEGAGHIRHARPVSHRAYRRQSKSANRWTVDMPDRSDRLIPIRIPMEDKSTFGSHISLIIAFHVSRF